MIKENKRKITLMISLIVALFILPLAFSLQINEGSVKSTPGVNNVTIEWTTDTISNGTTEVWISGSSERKVVSHGTLTTSHKLVAENLTTVQRCDPPDASIPMLLLRGF